MKFLFTISSSDQTDFDADPARIRINSVLSGVVTTSRLGGGAGLGAAGVSKKMG
jgi:hypothetical protein